MSKGRHAMMFERENLSTGVYHVRVSGEGDIKTGKLILIK
jgi:hypothetical protein